MLAKARSASARRRAPPTDAARGADEARADPAAQAVCGDPEDAPELLRRVEAVDVLLELREADPRQELLLAEDGERVAFLLELAGPGHPAVEAAVAAEMNVIGFTTQAHFLIGTGIERLLAKLQDDPLIERVQLARQTMLLTLPGEMGERFKVIALGKNYPHSLRGFDILDMAASL